MPQGRSGFVNKLQQRTASNLQLGVSQVVQVGRMQAVPIANLTVGSDLLTRGAQISFNVLSLQAVDSFVLLRNFSQDPGSAQAIMNWTAASLASTPQTYPIAVQYADNDPSISGQTAYYWVKAVPVSNATSSNVFLSAAQEFNASDQPSALQITGDYPICQAYTPTTQPLTAATGVPVNAATIDVAAFQIQYPFSLKGGSAGDLVSYNSGSITPLNDNTLYFVYFNDATYAGGAQTYIASVNNPDLTAGLYRQYLGNITTPVHGGGGTGGQGGGGGVGGPPCFSGNTRVHTKRGIIAIADVRPGDRVYSRTGWRTVERLLIHNHDGEMLEMGSGELVTPLHRIYKAGAWLNAKELFTVPVAFKGQVFNLELPAHKNDDGHCYLLGNGLMAHNARKS